jgi:hypothetical protein
MIKEVPSEVFNEGLDKWISRSFGEEGYHGNPDRCSYCLYYNKENREKGVHEGCQICPLSENNDCPDIYYLWSNAVFLYGIDSHQAMLLADLMVDFIISKCVYEV